MVSHSSLLTSLLPTLNLLPEVLYSLTAVFDQTNNAIHIAQYSNCGSNEKEITAEMNLGNVTGDCEAPDLQAADANSNPLSPSNGTGTGSNESSDLNSGAPGWGIPGLDQWFTIWAVIYILKFGVGFLL